MPSMLSYIDRIRGAFPGRANPNDPQQQMNWAIGKQGEIANQGLLTPELIEQYKKMLAPLFEKQRTNLYNAQNYGMNQASRSAGAYAASRGIDNPFALQQRARGDVFQSFAPQFGELETSQMGNLLNAVTQGQQFKYGGARDSTNLWSQLFLMNEQMKNQPNFLENLLSGLIQGGARAGATALFGG